MKRKHYPLLTVFAATVLTVVPLLLFSLIFGDQDSGSGQAEALLAKSDSVTGSQIRPPQSQTTKRLAPVKSNIAPTNTPVEVPARSAVAATAVPAIRRNENPANTKQHPPTFEPPVELVTVALDLTTATDPTIESTIEPTEDPAIDPTAELSRLDEALPEPPRDAIVKDTHYEATGHLLMVGQSHVEDLRVSEAEVAPRVAVVDKSDAASGKSSRSRSRRDKEESSGATDKTAKPSSEDSNPAKPSPKTDASQAAMIEDVIVQTPLETAGVGRVENVVAMTRAKGWPVALIRSDLPDDVWWVQQMVGIQGTSFAARVNFGNEFSLSGSAYRMVIVFLDSPDEVRRFRIAKQFKEIPEGVRRSREFHYIRN